MDVFVFQLVRRLDIIGIGDDTLDRADHDASGLRVIIYALAASIGIYDVYRLILKNSFIRALLAARVATNAFFCNQQ
jgi:hypothetical protein